jgi:hypothetical protein
MGWLSNSRTELMPIKKDGVDVDDGVVWIPDSKTATGLAEVPPGCLAVSGKTTERGCPPDSSIL